METLLFALGMVTLGFGLVSAKFDKSIVTPPMVFTGMGVVTALVFGHLVSADQERQLLEVVAEITLVIVLFTDASRIRLSSLIRDRAIPVRLLGIGLPLTFFAGALIATCIFPEFTMWESALLAAILAPTDAALGQAVVSSPSVPLKIRQSLNVESGLNDGIVLPLVMLCAALGSALASQSTGYDWLTYWVQQVTLGPLVGILVGAIGGVALARAKKAGWLNKDFEQLSGVALSFVAWSGALLIGGNGFIAAFVAGLTISSFAENIGKSLRDFGEAEGQLLVLVTFFLFGLAMIVPTVQRAGASYYLYAAISLTAIRMVPVAISVWGLKFHLPTIVFLGWFGPRGLASLLFGLLVVSKSELAHETQILDIAIVTVFMSILVHGLSAVPAASWYARSLNRQATADSQEHQPCEEHRWKFTQSADE